jgi:DNA/RNA-binding domain of Phe-tRNA-synthetase-like protein
MYFVHTPAIWRDFPQLTPGFLVVHHLHPQVEAETYLQPWYRRARERLNQGPESAMPEIAAWRRAYSQMGLKPTQYRSAGEALLRRFKREDDLPRLHPLVDLCNAVSLAFAMPVAVFDIDKIDSFIEVRYAAGDEEYQAFSGEVEHPEPNEIIFADAARQVHARRWTFRQSRQSTISPATSRALIVSEGLHETAARDVTELIAALQESIAALWSPPQQQAILTAQTPRLDFE